MQDAGTQRNIEALAELVHVEGVHAPVLDAGSDQPGDRAKPGAALERYPESSAYPVDVLLIVDRDNPPRTPALSEKAVEAVKRADVKDATALKPIRVEQGQAVAVIARDARRVDPGRKRERVKPQRNRITDALSVQSRRTDRIEVGDKPLGTGRLGDRLDRLDRVCIDSQRTTSRRSFTR